MRIGKYKQQNYQAIIIQILDNICGLIVQCDPILIEINPVLSYERNFVVQSFQVVHPNPDENIFVYSAQFWEAKAIRH